MTFLTPDDVAARLSCTRRAAIAAMRVAGGWYVTDGELRLSEDAWQAWYSAPESKTVKWSGDFLPRADFVRRESWAYLIQCEDRIKIGSTTDMGQRLAALRTLSALPVRFVALLSASDQRITGVTLERALHACFWQHHDHDEWFFRQGSLHRFAEHLEAT